MNNILLVSIVCVYIKGWGIPQAFLRRLGIHNWGHLANLEWNTFFMLMMQFSSVPSSTDFPVSDKLSLGGI